MGGRRDAVWSGLLTAVQESWSHAHTPRALMVLLVLPIAVLLCLTSSSAPPPLSSGNPSSVSTRLDTHP